MPGKRFLDHSRTFFGSGKEISSLLPLLSKSIFNRIFFIKSLAGLLLETVGYGLSVGAGSKPLKVLDNFRVRHQYAPRTLIL